MAMNSPAYVISASEHSAALFRQASQSFLSGTGVVGSGDFLVTPNSPAAMNVLVAPGTAWIPGTILAGSGFGSNAGAQASVGNTNGGSSTSTGFPTTLTEQGGYFGYNDGQVTLGIASANPTNARIDLVVATIADAAYAGSSNAAVLQVVTGTAGATPAPPTVPQNSLVLSSVWVPAAASTITSGDLNDLRVRATLDFYGLSGVTAAQIASLYTPTSTSTSKTAASGQCMVVTGSSAVTITLPSHSSGQRLKIVNLSTGGTTVSGTNIDGVGLSAASSFPLGTVGASAELFDDGTNWYIVAGQQDTGWVALTLSTNWNAYAGAYAPAYRLAGNVVYLSGACTNNTGGVSSSPFAAFPGGIHPASAVYDNFVEIGGGSYAFSLTTAGAATVQGVTNGASFGLDDRSYRLS